MTAVRRALISVSDKTGLAELAKRLVAAGVEIVSSGGTSAFLSANGVAVTEVAEVTGSPEMLGGRVKTLHPRIHAAILARTDVPDDLAELAAQGIEPFQLVVVNLYPFVATVDRPGVAEAEAIEQIDIGGPALIRAAAKNHRHVGVVTSPGQYQEVAAAVEAGGLGDDLRRSLAAEAFFLTATYDAGILGWLHHDQGLPERMVVPLRRRASLRYGENPHQLGALYLSEGARPWWEGARLLQGKEMSFNNYLDAEAAWRLVADFDMPAAVVIKHTNPCGAAIAPTISEAFLGAWSGDPLAAYGGVVAINRPLDAATAGALAEGFVEVLVCPSVVDLGPLGTKSLLRILEAPPPSTEGLELRPLQGGFLGQPLDRVAGGQWRVMSRRQPSDEESADLGFAWVVVAHAASNAIVVAVRGAAVGVGAGDQSRIGAADRALAQAGDRAKGAVAASDAFFPFRDGIDALGAAGVTAVIEPGGSRRDDEVIAAADQAGMALVFTGTRHLRH